MNFIKNKKTQTAFLFLFLLSILYPAGAVIASPIIYAGPGCGGYGANTGASFSASFAVNCQQCACWCGHTEYCIPNVMYPKVPIPMSWLFDRKLCSCPAPGGSAFNSSEAVEAGKEMLSEANARDSIVDSMSGGGRESCAEWADRAWEEAGWDSPGPSTADWKPYMETYTGEANLKPGDALLIKSSASPTGRHIVLYHSAGTVVHDPGLAAGAAKFSSFSHYEKNIMGVIPAPY